MIAELAIATVALFVLGVLAVLVYCAIGHVVDHAEKAWGDTTFDDLYSHPYSQSGPAASERPGPGSREDPR